MNTTTGPKFRRMEDFLYGAEGSDEQTWMSTNDLEWALASIGRDLDLDSPDFEATLRAEFDAVGFFDWHPYHLMIADYGFAFFVDGAVENIRNFIRKAS